MDQMQLKALKEALRRQWEAEQEIAKIERDMLRSTAVDQVRPAQPTASKPSPIALPRPSGDAPVSKDEVKSLPKRIIELLEANQGRSIPTSEFVSALADANAPSVRSALNRMIGKQIARATDASGNVVREHYVLLGEKS